VFLFRLSAVPLDPTSRKVIAVVDASKPTKKKKKRYPQTTSSPLKSKPTHVDRNQTLDALRGLAIALMIVDHIAGLWLFIDIEPTSIRFATRLSMPLFASLMGYFLASSQISNWHRFWQIAAAAAALNLFYFTLYGQVEILASLLVAYLLHAALGPLFVGLFVTAYFYGVDPSVAYFDYPLSVVVACVAQGAILKRHGWRIGLLTSLLICLSLPLIEPPTRYVVFFFPIAIALIAWGAAHPQYRVKGLDFIGRHPLTVYLAQYAIIIPLQPR
jgi:hypothetical protein